MAPKDFPQNKPPRCPRGCGRCKISKRRRDNTWPRKRNGCKPQRITGFAKENPLNQIFMLFFRGVILASSVRHQHFLPGIIKFSILGEIKQCKCVLNLRYFPFIVHRISNQSTPLIRWVSCELQRKDVRITWNSKWWFFSGGHRRKGQPFSWWTLMPFQVAPMKSLY